MTNNTQTLLEFPCDFPIKVLGLASDQFAEAVLASIRSVLPTVTAAALTQRASKNAKYLALTIIVHVEAKTQLDAIYRALTATPTVLMAL